MKHRISLVVALLYIACNADSVTVASSQQSLDTILSDGSSKKVSDNQAAHTMYVPNPVIFSTQHGSFHHHAATPHYNLNRMNTEQLAWYFRTQGYTESEILSHPGLYMNQAYLALVKQLPQYPEFVKKYHNKYRAYTDCRKWWGKINLRYFDGMQEQFAQLYEECEKQQLAQEVCEQKRRQLKAQQEREARTQQQQKVNDYCAKIDAIRHDDEMVQTIPSHHQQARDAAYTQIKTVALDTVTRNYTVASATIIFVRDYDITKADLTTLRGNVYEHQLHSEFLEQCTEAHTISNYYALQSSNLLINAIGHSVAIGMEANRLQQPDTATIWASFGWKTLEIMKGIGNGLLLCTESVVHCINYPDHAIIKFVHALGNITGCCMRAIGTAVYWHELMEQGNALLMAQEMDDVATKIALCGVLCANTLSTLSVRNVAKNSTYIVVDMLITHKMLTLGSRLCSQLKPIVYDLIKNIGKEEVMELALQSAGECGHTAEMSLLVEELEANSTKNVLSSSKAVTEELTLEHALEKWHSSEKLKQLEQQCAKLGDKVADTRLGLCENKPNLLVKDYAKLEKIATQKYEYIRGTLNDINIIAKNTGIDVDIIKKIKEHIFFRKHILWDGIKKFPPDLDMANAWERLVANTFVKSDLELLKHEFAESILMGNCEVPWRNAHDITDTIYNWTQYLEGKI
jgi:hypothetical protein